MQAVQDYYSFDDVRSHHLNASPPCPKYTHMHPPCPKYTTDVNLFNTEPKKYAVTKDHTVSLVLKNNCKEVCLIGIAGKRASQLVTLARWRMDAVLVRCNAVSKTCSKVKPVGCPQQLFTRGVDRFFLACGKIASDFFYWGPPVIFLTSSLLEIKVRVDLQTKYRLQQPLRGKTSVSCCIATV